MKQSKTKVPKEKKPRAKRSLLKRTPIRLIGSGKKIARVMFDDFSTGNVLTSPEIWDLSPISMGQVQALQDKLVSDKTDALEAKYGTSLYDL